MDRETVIQNILVNYGRYGVTSADIEPVIDSGVKEGLTYDLIYLMLKTEFSKLIGEEFYCTSEDMARVFGVSVDEMNKIIEESKEELLASGKNPDEYFRSVETTRFMM